MKKICQEKNMSIVNMDLEDIVGDCYYEFWMSKKRFVVCKGSRASKKSKISALWHIAHMMLFPFANTLVVRQTEDKLRESCYAELEWAIERLGAKNEWVLRRNPMEMIYKRYNNRIIFRGLQDQTHITSIAVPK
jgi:phage terminase large subunit